MRIERHFSLKSYNTFCIDSHAAMFIEYDSKEDLEKIYSMKKKGDLPLPVVAIGGGSNILFSEEEFRGTILHSSIKSFEIRSENEENVEVEVGSGYVWDDFVEKTVENGWYGAENLSLIPGEAGGAAVQNIGAYGAEVKDIIVKVCTFDMDSGGEHVFSVEECGYGYRKSVFKSPEHRNIIVTSVVFRLSKIPEYNFSYKVLSEKFSGMENISLKEVRDCIISIRNFKLPDPKKIGSAGSFFKNPVVSSDVYERLKRDFPDIPCFNMTDGSGKVKLFAAWLIERSGWKGKSLGNAGVYEKQALVLVNRGNATGKDVSALSDAVVSSVKEKFGINLEKEVIVL